MFSAVGAVLLLTWLALAVGVLVVVFVRWLKKNGMPPGLTDPDQPFLSSVFDSMPRTPRTEWADWNTDSEDSDGRCGGPSCPTTDFPHLHTGSRTDR